MTGKYLNRNLISEAGMSFSIKTAADEFSPYNQRPRLLPPWLLQLRLPRSFPLLYCFQMLLGRSCCGSRVPATSPGNAAPSARPARRQRCLCRGRLTPQWSCSHTAKKPSLLLSKSHPSSSRSILIYQDTQLLMKELVGMTPTRRVLAVVRTAPVGPFSSVPLI